MKIQIIPIDRHDDVLSVLDKISWAKSPRMVLVWPETGRVLTRRLDLVILQRASLQSGAQLGLVTRDDEVIANATEVGVPVFKSVSGAQKSYWKHNRKLGPLLTDRRPPQDLRSQQSLNRILPQPVWMDSHWVKYTFFFLAVASLLIMMAAFIPSATIIVTPQSQIQTVNIPILASSQIKAINLTGNLPAHYLSMIVEGQNKIDTTGRVVFADRKAVGIARFTNLTDQVVAIPSHTIVSTTVEPIRRYSTTLDSKVEPGSGKTTDSPIEAMTPGEAANQSDNSIRAIEGSLGLQLTVTNPYAMTGGSSNLSRALSQADHDQLHDLLVKMLQQAALSQLSKSLTHDDQLIPETLTLKNTLDEKISSEINQPADTVSLSLRLEFVGMIISGSDIRTLAQAALDANLSGASLPLNNTLEITSTDKPVVGETNVRWQIKAQRQVMTQLSRDQIIAYTKGFSPADASSRISKQVLLKNPPIILLNPAWWPTLPIFPFRILVVVSGVS